MWHERGWSCQRIFSCSSMHALSPYFRSRKAVLPGFALRSCWERLIMGSTSVFCSDKNLIWMNNVKTMPEVNANLWLLNGKALINHTNRKHKIQRRKNNRQRRQCAVSILITMSEHGNEPTRQMDAARHLLLLACTHDRKSRAKRFWGSKSSLMIEREASHSSGSPSQCSAEADFWHFSDICQFAFYDLSICIHSKCWIIAFFISFSATTNAKPKKSHFSAETGKLRGLKSRVNIWALSALLLPFRLQQARAWPWRDVAFFGK